MSVPKFKKFYLPVFQSLASGNELHIREIRALVIRDMQLTEEDIQDKVRGGSQSKVHNRVGWVLADLYRANLAERPQRGVYKLSKCGNELLAHKGADLHGRILEVVDRPFKTNTSENDTPLPPDEALVSAYEAFRDELEGVVLSRLVKAPPEFLEKTVVNLLIAMGYGGGDETMGQVTGKTGDRGIDGIIKEDVLGLDVVYLQTKRYTRGSNISAAQVREFVGSLALRGAQKGVLVTTSDFTPAAKKAAVGGPNSIVLIDGKKLARLMVRHNIGVRVRDPLRPPMQIKVIDENFFEEE